MWVSGVKEDAQVSYWRVVGFKGLAKVLFLGGAPAVWGWRLCMEADPSGRDGKLWLGSSIIITCIAFGARPFWRALRIERRAIRREGDHLVIEGKGGVTDRVRFENVQSVSLSQVTRGPQSEGGGLVVIEAGALRDVEEKAEKMRPQGTGIKIRLKSKEEVHFGHDLDYKKTERLLRELKDRFGLPVEGF